MFLSLLLMVAHVDVISSVLKKQSLVLIITEVKIDGAII